MQASIGAITNASTRNRDPTPLATARVVETARFTFDSKKQELLVLSL